MPVRLGMAGIIYGVATPLVKILEAAGRLDRVMGEMGARQQRELAKNNPFGNYQATKHDVFVAVYVKSGTNWTMQIAHQLLNRGNAEFDHIHNVVPWPDAPPILGKYSIPVEDPSVWAASPEQKRVIKSHLEWELLPYSGDARYILVIRDPKDVFVSSYFFLRDTVLGPAMPSVDTWYKIFVSRGSAMAGNWATHAAGYWAQRNRPNVLLLSFKEMKRDLRSVVERIANFLEVDVSANTIDLVTKKSSFSYMKTIDHKFRPWRLIPWGKPPEMMRKGAQGDSSELLTLEQQRHIDQYFIAELRRMGSDFPYQEFADLA
jgi:hypothetical protein